MARAKIHHSSDACHLLVIGNKKSPEPTLHVIKFPGGEVEVSRCTNQQDYWVHIHLYEDTKILDSRLNDRNTSGIKALKGYKNIKQIALKVNGVYEEY